MLYTVKDIIEDIDYGCEERPSGDPVLSVVLLTGDDGSNAQIKMPDHLLIERKIEAGCRVCFDENSLLQRIFE